MLGSIWRRLVREKLATAAARGRRPVRRVEGLEDRVTPAAVFAVQGADGSVSVYDAVNRQPTLTGTAEPGSTAEVSADDGSGLVSLGTTTADATTGAWALSPPDALADGASTVTAVATDAAGNACDPPAAFALVIDGSAPDATVNPTGAGGVCGTAPDTGGSGVARVRVSTREPGADGLYFDEATQGFTSDAPLFFDATDDSAGGDFSTWFYALPSGTSGGYAVPVRVTDLAGNEADSPTTPVLVS